MNHEQPANRYDVSFDGHCRTRVPIEPLQPLKNSPTCFFPEWWKSFDDTVPFGHFEDPPMAFPRVLQPQAGLLQRRSCSKFCHGVRIAQGYCSLKLIVFCAESCAAD